MRKRKQNELIGFLAIWAVQYQKDYGLDGLHPTHYDLMVKHGARMDSFAKATNAPRPIPHDIASLDGTAVVEGGRQP